MQTPLISGRDFDERDQGSPNVAIVNQAFVARYYQSRNPVGQYLSATVTRPPSDLQIVGVVKDVTTRSLRLPPRPTVYVSYFQRTPRADSLVIRVAGSFSQAASAIRKELQPSFPNTALDVLALDDQVGRTLVQERLLANVAGGFRSARACSGVCRTIRVVGLQRRPPDQGNRHTHGARRTTARGAVDDRRACPSSGGRGCSTRFTDGLGGLAMATLYAVRLDAHGPKRNRGCGSVAGDGGDAGCVLSGKTGHARGSHHCLATRVRESIL